MSPLSLPRSVSSTLAPPRRNMSPCSDFGPDTIEEHAPDEMTGLGLGGFGPGYQTVQTHSQSLRLTRSMYNRPKSTSSPPQLHSHGPNGHCHACHENHEAVDEDNMVDDKIQWWKPTANKFRAVELDNIGSVARDHLALGWFPPCEAPAPPFYLKNSSTNSNNL